MPRTPMPDDTKKSRSVGVRVTPEQYVWLRKQAKELSEQTRVHITTSAIVARLIGEAMEGAGGVAVADH